ncbi:MAG: Ig-like domain repeat protein, partial [Methanobacterium paludis]|nr:Ig-like domain repeat protein [Methanobacterium paludis]
STFINNRASSYGGAIYAVGALKFLNGCMFINNTASSYGGAICFSGTSTPVNGSTFLNNTANKGGAIYNAAGTIIVNFSSFTNNNATSGSAIYRSSGTVTAEYNWWGSNSDPASQMYGTVDYSNWLYMTETVVPTTVANGTTAVVTVNFNNIWNGSSVVSIDPASGHIADGTVVNFTSDLGTFSPVTATTTNGIVTTTFTATNDIIGAINATTDNQTVSYLINRLATVISVGNVTGVSGETTNLTATLTDGNGIGISGETVTVTVNGTSYTATTDSTGLATVTVTAPVTAGTYNVTASFAGDSAYQPSSSNGTSYLTVQLRDAYVSPTGNDTSGTGTSSNPFATIQKALQNVVTGGTVHLKAGTYTGTGNKGLTISRNVTITGENPATTIIDAQYLTNIWTVNSGVTVILENLSLVNANTTSNGGAISNAGNLTAINCTFANNTVKTDSANGGAIYNTGTIYSLSNCTFTGNAACYGGAIYNINGIITSMDNCTFTGNAAQLYGGAIYTYGNMVTSINDCIFTSNTLTYQGGAAIYNYKGTITVINSTFANNTAYYYGGAIYNNAGTMTFTSCSFIGNSATSTSSANGGAIYSQNGPITITYSSFINNSAKSGGAIYSVQNVNVHFSSFVNNTASNGSSIYRKIGTVNAEYNWWGSNSSPSSQISGTVDYSNWLYMTVTTGPGTLLN